jgi:hypothetical protein
MLLSASDKNVRSDSELVRIFVLAAAVGKQIT